MNISKDKAKQKEIRSKYIEAIGSLLLGPGSEKINTNLDEEIISEKPQSRYSTGILYPFKEDISKRELEEITVDIQDGFDKEDSVEIDNSFIPSAIGITFYCKTQIKELKFSVATACYEPLKNPYIETTAKVLETLKQYLSESRIEKVDQLFEIDEGKKRIRLKSYNEETDEKINNLSKEMRSNETLDIDTKFLINKIKNINYNKKSCFQRKPLVSNLLLKLYEGMETKEIKFSKEYSVQLFSKIKNLKIANETVTAVTLVVKNNSKNHFFQTEIKIPEQEGISFAASEDIKVPNLEKLNQEDAMNLFLYRQKKTYALGRGVSAVWEEVNGTVTEIKTSYLPSYELFPMSFEIPELEPDILRADSYIDMEKESQISKLNSFVAAYDNWIKKMELSIGQLIPEFQKFARENIKRCQDCSLRMKKTILFLKEDYKAFEAFNLANKAMLLQRADGAEQKAYCYETSDFQDIVFNWRPFQLAFVLHSLESILNEKSDDREILDLIWVSTGGGKTEAYLFAIAAVIIYRRMKYNNSAGVSVIMRYTLRLLTAQQFERASQLICALEFIRRRVSGLGDTEITIGLWIGEGTNNYLKGAKADFESMVKAESLEEAKRKNTFQVLKCPWCKEEHSIIPKTEFFKIKRRWGYSPIDSSKPKYNMKCNNKNCEFSKCLPIYVVDESIYNIRPTLLFGTVDKFAQVPLKEETQHLFGSDDLTKYRRPELIIQDELHLISGPLGSIVGLYEAGFDYIFKSGEDIIPPKYIASTATIRNAEEQVKAIFDRKVFQFPPNGIDIADNFFVKENITEPGRAYLGIMSTGKSQVTTEIRLLAAMLQTITELGLEPDEEELFWTITGYFNSIRELGKASGLIRDDVKEYINQLNRRNNTKKRYLWDNTSVELTSRKSGIEIPEILNKLEVRHAANDRKDKKYPIDTLIATNMLSVGVDISRLNAMFVVGQPKLTSEYIQATSRVGRDSLGLVCTLYNSSRSRDRSHYETFQSYHQSMYRFVEASSVTPFSAPALTKAVAAVIVAMLRNNFEELSGDNTPINILNDENRLDTIIEYLMNRVRDNEDKYRLYSEDAEIIMREFTNSWLELARDAEAIEGAEHETRYYLYRTKTQEFLGKLLLRSFDDRSFHEEATRVMGTMRNVEDTAYMRLVD
ncbi:DNA helicase [Enterococcus sp. ALS3]|uniref:DNA helicase n=1 Tax=Enterococcus alishanensis TaxID=1303817 RepID=A0ABS6TG16_9ENTE|nr:helicase-related protein [Enterococcus alishanensis]MBV7391840.1 DNA helicase [Enterococcus alishanensis]